ncbi:TPA: M48 family metalloprotease [Legionella pneumophila]|nr:M48 family metalloprotease [Legionella pneumophila]
MNKINGLLKALLFALVIPAIGLALSVYIINDLNHMLESTGIKDITLLCKGMYSEQLKNISSDALQEACNEVKNIVLLGKGSVLGAAIGILNLFFFWLASIYAGESRERIAKIFPNVLPFSILLIAVSILLQGAILTYGAYIGESYFYGKFHPIFIGLVAFGAFIAGVRIIGVAISFGRKLQMSIIGKVLKEADAPQLFSFVHSLAQKLGAKEPQNIIIGLEPAFYVTNVDIQVPGYEKQIAGETLYVSAPLARILSKEEFASVIGHELGHFRGNDTIYTMRFAPVYAGLGKALGTLAPVDDDHGLTTLPAIAMLTYMYESFASNVAKISRVREHKADEAGVEAGSAMALSTALIKLSLYSSLWNHAIHQNIERLNLGKVTQNLSIVFQDMAKYDVEHESIEQIMELTLKQSISHPTDSHPPVSKRLEALGINSEKITKEMLLPPPENVAINLLDKAEEIEQEITLLQHQLMVAYGIAKPPEEAEQNILLHAIYSLGAAMVVADGKIDIDEVMVAEGIGQKLFDDFDSVEFREYCNNPDKITDVILLTEGLRELLEDEGKNLVIKYLRTISIANGNISKDEELLLEKIAAGLGVALD